MSDLLLILGCLALAAVWAIGGDYLLDKLVGL